VRRACIDIGSNTTRLLVADCDRERLLEVHQERAFTHIRRGMGRDGAIAAWKLEEVAGVVRGQVSRARAVGAEEVFGVATGAIRRAANASALVGAVRASCGMAVEVLAEREEARLAFVGAAATLGHVPTGPLGVADVGGGSSELVVGTAPDRVTWSGSFELGSADLADRYLHSDPPSEAEMASARAAVEEALHEVEVPPPQEAVAVGGSETSIRLVAGPLLDADAFVRSLQLLGAEQATDVARRFTLDLERVRLLPAGLLILEAVSNLFGVALKVGRGGLREGVLLERAQASRSAEA
jgi:exopolyphosphatase / guanosine-5'-triphosphate,3'-diphosphate pyrophosphatase